MRVKQSIPDNLFVFAIFFICIPLFSMFIQIRQAQQSIVKILAQQRIFVYQGETLKKEPEAAASLVSP